MCHCISSMVSQHVIVSGSICTAYCIGVNQTAAHQSVQPPCAAPTHHCSLSTCTYSRLLEVVLHERHCIACLRRLQGLSIWIAHLETPSGTLASPFGNYTAVLPLGISPLLPQLAPVVIVPVLLAAAGTRLRLPPVLLTAASAGMHSGFSGAVMLAVNCYNRTG